MGLIRVKSPGWFRLLKSLLVMFPVEFTDTNQRGRLGGAVEFFTQEQAREIAARIGYTQGYERIHKAMWREGLTNWQDIAERLNKNGQSPLAFAEIKNIGEATAFEIVRFGLTKDLLWFE